MGICVVRCVMSRCGLMSACICGWGSGGESSRLIKRNTSKHFDWLDVGEARSPLSLSLYLSLSTIEYMKERNKKIIGE